MPYDVTMPDGTVIKDVPEGTTKADLQKRYQEHLDAQTLAQKQDQIHGKPGFQTLAEQGITLGWSDEAAGVGGVISGLLHGDTNVGRNYRVNRDAERMRIDEARQRKGAAGSAVEFVSGMGSGSATAKAGASLANAVRAGAEFGGVGGAGYGKGVEGTVVGAITGALGGGALGALGYGAGKLLEKRAQVRAAKQQQAAPLIQADQAEGGGMLNRAMVDPSLQNKVTAADASVGGGPTIKRSMERVQGNVENRVANLGAGGERMEPTQAGQVVQDAADRWIKATGSQGTTGAKYARAAQMAGNTTIMPAQSVQQIDGLISDLSQTPNTNAAEINFLKGLKEDLSQGLTVDALRTIRTQLRGKITGNDLTFGANQARVLGIMDAASNDLENGLIAAGRPQAAQAYQAADKAYRARADFIDSVLQKVVGGRNANKSPEQVFQTMQSMAKGKDAIGLRKLYATFTPEERADFAATFADQLGRNNKGDFTFDQFARQTSQFSDSALKTIFGQDGAQSVQNLRLLSKEGGRVMGAMNSRKSGSGVAINYRNWLRDLLGGGLTGSVVGGGPIGAIAGAAVTGGTKAGSEYLTARMLMSPDITKWMAQAPATTSPAAINAHFARLSEIAKLEPALANDIGNLQRGIMQAANDNIGLPAPAAADDNQKKQQSAPQ